MSTITDQDNHNEMIQIGVLTAIEDLQHETITKAEFDALIMLSLEMMICTD